MKNRNELETNEPHPAASSAYHYVCSLGREKLSVYLEACSSCAIEGNRMGEICAETLNRVLYEGKPVSDRYILGLAWFLKDSEEKEKIK